MENPANAKKQHWKEGQHWRFEFSGDSSSCGMLQVDPSQTLAPQEPTHVWQTISQIGWVDDSIVVKDNM